MCLIINRDSPVDRPEIGVLSNFKQPLTYFADTL